MSSGGIAPTDGQYGSAPVTGTAHPQWRIDPFLLQVYSSTRVAALMAVVLNMFSFDNSAKVNCQVSPCPTSDTLWLTVIPKALFTMNNVSHLVLCDQGATPNTPLFFT
jgi:hypothetical protein